MKSSAFAEDILRLVFLGTSIAGIADNAVTAPRSQLTVALHIADPGIGGDQTTNEVSYTGYARVNVARNSTGWTVTGPSVSPAANINFGMMTGGIGGTVTHVSVGTGVSNKILWSGPVTPNLLAAVGLILRLTPATAIGES